MNSNPFFPMMLTGIITQLPLVFASLLGVIISLARWRAAPSASRWTLVASLLSLLVCVGAPVAQPLVMAYTRQAGLSASGVGFYFSALNFLWATLRACTFCLLLVGVYAGRRAAAGPGLPPPPSMGYPTAAPLR